MAKDNDNSPIVWFVAGTAIGATVALLFAPHSGEETRRRIGKKAVEGKEYLAETADDLAVRGRAYYDRGRELADEAAEMFEKGRKMVQG